jgi:hypothetical protein
MEESLSFTVDGWFAAIISRVRPRVQLLVQPRTPGRLRRARDLFAYLAPPRVAHRDRGRTREVAS